MDSKIRYCPNCRKLGYRIKVEYDGNVPLTWCTWHTYRGMTPYGTFANFIHNTAAYIKMSFPPSEVYAFELL